VNALSPLTYYRRHKRSALLQIALISLATVGLFVLVAVLDTIPLRANVSYLTRLSHVTPIGDALDPTVAAQIETHPDVARVIPDNGLWRGISDAALRRAAQGRTHVRAAHQRDRTLGRSGSRVGSGTWRRDRAGD